MNEKQKLGKYGEDLACKYLEKNNYKIIERNFSCYQGEIDIIAFDENNNELVFFEIKTRRDFSYGIPAESVNKKKQLHIKNTIKYYIYLRKIEDTYIRIDIIEIVLWKNRYKLNHLKKVL